MKCCAKCNNTLSLDSFYKSKKAADGVQSWCISCKQLWQKSNKAKKILYQKKYRMVNRNLLRLKNKEYYIANRTKRLLYHKKYDKDHAEKRRASARIRRHNRTPMRKLSDAMSCGIRMALINGKFGVHWENIVSYTARQLKLRLEGLFANGMTWDNYGKWHVDHIIPISFFEYKTPMDVEFKMCWRLENLQPLWAKDNLKKGSKIPTVQMKINL